jgi:YbbR domain-containing protein
MMRSLTKDLGWKLVSLAVAFILWMVMVGTRELTTSVPVPVQYRNVPPHLEISSDFVETVHLILRGPSATLSRISASPPPLIIDLAPVNQPGEKTFPISRAQFDLPSGVDLDRAIPAQIRMRLELRVEKEVPVEVRISHVPEGMRVAKIESTPAAMRIVGPESRVRAIERVETDPVDLRALGPDGEAVANVYPGHAQVTCKTSPAVRVRAVLEPVKD